MENAELLAIQPVDYLKNGFFDESGQLQEGLNGYYSLAMAYRLREEQADPDQLKSITDQMKASSNQKNLTETLRELQKKSSSLTIAAIFRAATPWVKDSRDFDALAQHLQRILSQFVLIRSLPETE